MKTTLNNYTIDDFLKLKPIIYEYCCNLTQKKNQIAWYRDFASAQDLYQDTFIALQTKWFNIPRTEMEESRFIQIMKNWTYWTYHRRFKSKNNKLFLNLNHYQDSDKSNFLFEKDHFENAKYFEDIQDHPDYNFYMKNLKLNERLAIQYFLKGYTKTEIAKKYNKDYSFITRIVKKIEGNALADKFNKPLVKVKPKKEVIVNDLVFVREKLSNFDKVFKKNKSIKSFENDRKIKMYSLYLQGVSNMEIAKKLGKPLNQINVEIFRINQKIKKYNDNRTL